VLSSSKFELSNNPEKIHVLESLAFFVVDNYVTGGSEDFFLMGNIVTFELG